MFAFAEVLAGPAMGSRARRQSISPISYFSKSSTCRLGRRGGRFPQSMIGSKALGEPVLLT